MDFGLRAYAPSSVAGNGPLLRSLPRPCTDCPDSVPFRHEHAPGNRLLRRRTGAVAFALTLRYLSVTFWPPFGYLLAAESGVNSL